jgi:phosphopantothenoylcysteine decarboxylase / phosphopantothenate---cysteine ligase
VRVSKHFNNLRGKKVLITAGPTREHWDPVRFLSNGSSGQMGIALALEAARLGADVILILGPVPGPIPRRRKNLRILRVKSAQEMDEKVQEHLEGTRVFVGSAAVSDYRPAATAHQKLKEKPTALTLRLLRNPDIISKVARRGPNRPPVVIGFALETQDMMENAAAKLRDKGLDWIVANRETNLGAPEGSATLLSRWNERISIGHMTKERLAKQIWKALLDRPAL